VIDEVARSASFHFEVIDIDDPHRAEWRRLYDHHVPVVHVNGRQIARHRLEESQLREALGP